MTLHTQEEVPRRRWDSPPERRRSSSSMGPLAALGAASIGCPATGGSGTKSPSVACDGRISEAGADFCLQLPHLCRRAGEPAKRCPLLPPQEKPAARRGAREGSTPCVALPDLRAPSARARVREPAWPPGRSRAGPARGTPTVGRRRRSGRRRECGTRRSRGTGTPSR